VAARTAAAAAAQTWRQQKQARADLQGPAVSGAQQQMVMRAGTLVATVVQQQLLGAAGCGLQLLKMTTLSLSRQKQRSIATLAARAQAAADMSQVLRLMNRMTGQWQRQQRATGAIPVKRVQSKMQASGRI